LGCQKGASILDCLWREFVAATLNAVNADGQLLAALEKSEIAFGSAISQ
jgi:hypothetical protein